MCIPRSPVRHYHNLGGLKELKQLSVWLWEPGAQINVLAGLCSLWDERGLSTLCVFWRLVDAHIPWLVSVQLQLLPPDHPASCCFVCLLLCAMCLCLSQSLSYEGAGACIQGNARQYLLG